MACSPPDLSIQRMFNTDRNGSNVDLSGRHLQEPLVMTMINLSSRHRNEYNLYLLVTNGLILLQSHSHL